MNTHLRIALFWVIITCIISNNYTCAECSHEAIFLGTHDIQDISITSPSAGTIWITGNFIPDSPAVGIVVAVLNTSKISFYLLRREGNQLGNEGILSNIEGGQHMVSVFVVDRTGLPFNRAATIPQNVVVNGKSILNVEFTIQHEIYQ